RVVAVEILAAAVADGARVGAEQRIERFDVVRPQRLLVAIERRRDFGDDIGEVDVHHSHPGAPAGAANSVCSLPRRPPGLPGGRIILRKSGRPDLRRGRGGERAFLPEPFDSAHPAWHQSWCMPPPCPSPASGGGDAVALSFALLIHAMLICPRPLSCCPRATASPPRRRPPVRARRQCAARYPRATARR